jgi:hypothetical protein
MRRVHKFVTNTKSGSIKSKFHCIWKINVLKFGVHISVTGMVTWIHQVIIACFLWIEEFKKHSVRIHVVLYMKFFVSNGTYHLR